MTDDPATLEELYKSRDQLTIEIDKIQRRVDRAYGDGICIDDDYDYWGDVLSSMEQDYDELLIDIQEAERHLAAIGVVPPAKEEAQHDE